MNFLQLLHAARRLGKGTREVVVFPVLVNNCGSWVGKTMINEMTVFCTRIGYLDVVVMGFQALILLVFFFCFDYWIAIGH